MANNPEDTHPYPIRPRISTKVQKDFKLHDDDLSLENLDKIEEKISSSFEKIDPTWFLTEETKKTRERYLYLSAACVLFLLTDPSEVTFTWPVSATLQIINREPLDLSLICVCVGIGANYLVSARSELAQHTYKWKMALANFDILSIKINDHTNEIEKLIKSTPNDPAYAPEHLKAQLSLIKKKSKNMQENFRDLSIKNERIVKYGNYMPSLTFIFPLLINLSALLTGWFLN